jgi:predicted ATPase
MKGRLKTLKVKNLLSLRDVTIDFGEQLTVLVGPNAGGKSNIIKTLEIIKKILTKSRPFLSEIGINLSDIIFGKTQGSAQITLESMINDHIILHETLLENNKATWRVTVPPLQNQVVDFLLNMGFYSFIPQSMLSEVEIEETSRLSRDGSNLAGLLAYLKLTDYKLFHIIEERLRDYVPEVEELVIKPGTIPIALKKVVRLQLREKGFESSFTEISDGTLRLLGFVTAMSMNHSLVAFEEPENCVHPHLLETLVDMMRKADCQVIVTTHSPYLLSHVRPEEVIVVWREMGEEGLETKVKRPSEEELARVRGLLEEGWTLGEVWYSGIIGGTPE